MLNGSRVCITGKLVFYKREEAFQLIEARGGIAQRDVTKDTDYLVVGYYPLKREDRKSRKLEKVEEYLTKGRPINIIKEDDFLIMAWGGEP